MIGLLMLGSFSAFANVECTVDQISNLSELNWRIELGSDGCNQQVGYPVVENAILEEDGSCSIFINYMESGTQTGCKGLTIPSPRYVVNKIRVKKKLKRACKKLEKNNVICM